MLKSLASASRHELRAERQRLLAQAITLIDHGLALQEEAERYLVGPQADPERYMELHTHSMQVHKLHMQVHAEMIQVHKHLHWQERDPPLCPT